MTTFCMNISNKALTKSDGITFLRQFRIGTKHYGINTSGVYLIDGNTDNGTAFDSFIKTTANGLGEEAKKRLPEIRAEKIGDITTAIIYDDDETSTGVEQGDSGFIRYGKGGGGKFVSLMIHSTDENLKINSIKLMPQIVGVGAL